jgi:uncharacterized protein YabE (DUF348 family)
VTESGNHPGGTTGYGSGSGHADSFSPTDWFSPVGGTPSATAVLERPTDKDEWRSQHPDFSPELSITPHDVYVALGPQADDLMASVNVDVDELIRLINAETTMLPPIVDVPGLQPRRVGELVEEPEEAPAGLVTAVKKWKGTFLRATIAAIMVSLTGGGAAALAMNKSVTVEVDGHEHQVNTYAGTVGEVLESEGLSAGAHDSLSPSPSASIGDGGKIVLQRGRLVKMTVDGEKRESWVRALTVQDALRQLGMPTQDVWMSTEAGTSIPVDGISLEIKTLKTVKLFDGANEMREISTHAVTVDELLRELQMAMGPEDSIAPSAEIKILDGAEIRINRTGVTVVNRNEQIPPPRTEIKDPNAVKGTETVVDPGEAGEQIVTYRITLRNGKETAKEKLGSQVIKEPKAKVVKVGTKIPSDVAVWYKLAQCEATGNWAINTGNGYYGGLQFDASTWRSNGGTQYAPLPHQATPEQQIAIATKVRDARGGYSAWPACARKLGLPT